MNLLGRALTIYLSLLWALQTFAAEGQAQFTLKDLTSEASEKMSIVTLRFASKPTWTKLLLEDHGSFLQLRLADTMTVNSGTFYDGQGPFVKKVALFQGNENETVARLFLTTEAAMVKDATDVQILNTRVVITIDHTAVKKTPNEKIAGVAVKEKPPASFLDAPSVPATIGTPGSFDYEGDLKALAWASLGIFALLLFSLTAKRYLKNRRLLAEGREFISMKTISTLALSPKQKLSLIQVGGEQFLLAICPDSINLITSIGGHRNAAMMAAPYTAIQRAAPPPPQALEESPRHAPAPEKKRSFADVLAEKEKRPEPPREASPRKEAKVPRTDQGKRVNYSITDNGVENLNEVKAPDAKTSKTIDDVTKIIREKLKNLPKLS